MPEYVLTVWQHGDVPPDGGPPMRLSEVGGEPIAVHADGFDTSAFVRAGEVIDPEACLTAARLLDVDRQRWVGATLWARLTPGDLGPAFDQAPGKDRVYLDLRSDDLKSYPWELLRRGNWDVFRAGRTVWCLGRPDPATDDNAGDPPDIGHPVRVLVVLGNRSDDVNIRARQELMIIEREAHRKNTDVLLRTLLYPTARDIEDALSTFHPHLFHFIGHGGTNAVQPPQVYVYSRQADISEPWDADRVRTVFSRFPPRVVVLNACQTAHAPTQATSLVDAFADAGCLATLAMMGEILGTASEAFSERLYQELFTGSPIDVATTGARMAVSEITGDGPGTPQQRSNWVLPRLYVRGHAATAITLPYAAQPVTVTGLKKDFVTRWNERWLAWRSMDGSLKGASGAESRLVVLTGVEETGKLELLNTLAAARQRAGEAVVFVDLANKPTGLWRDLLQRITERAAAVGFDVTALKQVTSSKGTSAEVIPQFLAQLETLARPGGDPHQPVLIVINGLSTWEAFEVQQTVLPRLCWPLVNASPTSRLRMMISLVEMDIDETWPARPQDWAPLPLDGFDVDEWDRALEHFRDHWLEPIAKNRPEKSEIFSTIASSYRGARYAVSLDNLRKLAEVLLR